MILDQLNRSILTELHKNARYSNAEIGRIVGLSAPAVAERIKKMQDEGIISSFTIDLNFAKIGYMLQVFIAIKLHGGKLKNFLAYTKSLNEVVETHRVTGNDCLIMKIITKSPEALESLLSEFIEYGETTTSVILSSPDRKKILTF